MITRANDFSISVATVNGSGSQSSNLILAKTMFRMGLKVGAKNLFPSNIAGLPTWFSIRVHPEGFVGRRLAHDIVICKNSDTFLEDVRSVATSGYFFYDADIKDAAKHLRADVSHYGIPFRELAQTVTDSIKMRKFLTNMIYVGVLAELLKMNFSILQEVVADQFQHKGDTVALNLKAIECGQKYAREHLSSVPFRFAVKELTGANTESILIDGNSAAALGSVAGGCTFLSWYPITPSSSLAESFQTFSEQFHVDENQKNKVAVVQSEDELSAINMVIGAGWAGSRAMTATSGPGLSLMAEAAGLSYFAEVPAVIWDVQRAGPSTGLPTRTLQADLRAAAHLSHGDTEHIVLLPAHPAECFEFAQVAFDLAEELQTLVIVLSDLDIGMNLSMSPEFKLTNTVFRRGKVLDAEKLIELESKGQDFARYRDVDGDGICYRTLPGTPHMKAAFFTRGTGHTERATYTEDAPTFAKVLTRLKNKMQTATKMLPKPQIVTRGAKVALLAYGSSDFVIAEVRAKLSQLGTDTDYIRLRALPLQPELESVLSHYDQVFVIEQNRDAQMRAFLCEKFAAQAQKFISVLSFDGLPLAAENVVRIIEQHKAGAKHG